MPFVDSFMLQPRNDRELPTTIGQIKSYGSTLLQKGWDVWKKIWGSSTVYALDHVRRDGGNSLPGNVFQPHPPSFHTPLRAWSQRPVRCEIQTASPFTDEETEAGRGLVTQAAPCEAISASRSPT